MITKHAKQTVISEKSIAESLKIVLLKKKINIAKLADKMNIVRTTLYSKFQRDNFTMSDLEKICKALDINFEVNFIIDEDD